MAELYKLKPGFSLMSGFMENAIFKIHRGTFKTFGGLEYFNTSNIHAFLKRLSLRIVILYCLFCKKKTIFSLKHEVVKFQ
jgi:hypothetical protein